MFYRDYTHSSYLKQRVSFVRSSGSDLGATIFGARGSEAEVHGHAAIAAQTTWRPNCG